MKIVIKLFVFFALLAAILYLAFQRKREEHPAAREPPWANGDLGGARRGMARAGRTGQGAGISAARPPRRGRPAAPCPTTWGIGNRRAWAVVGANAAGSRRSARTGTRSPQRGKRIASWLP